MDNRQYNGQGFYSEFVDLETTIKNIIDQEDDFVDFYIFLDKAFRDGKRIISFHCPHSYIKEYINSYQYSYDGNEVHSQEEIIHQELIDGILDDTNSMEKIYRLFIKYLCFGMRFRFSISQFSEMGFGVMATFNFDFELKEKLIIEPEMNQSFHCVVTEK
jgi:hypothetical protein